MTSLGPQRAIALWGGPECTVNRVGDQWFDQLVRTGHDQRFDDLDRISALGLRTVRYPVLWERVCADGRPNWSWSDARLARLRELGITPIVGLLHHGSGPRDTSLLHADFPERFAAYASAVAQRYPWVRAYTPINEPLTTARFSALYGHWFPHARSDEAFARALWNQCRATVLAMRAIRSVQPAAQLVQTEDLGTVSGRPSLRAQTAFENERRWLTWDVLAGRVNRRHRLWRFLHDCGLSEADLELARRECCPADWIGVNHYVTSDRFLDDRLERYAPEQHGGNGRRAYADVETVRVLGQPAVGLDSLLLEAAHRYDVPVAVTEAHLGCTREEQLRWLTDVWDAAHAARLAGADVRAVTVWALFGSYDWDSLVTRDRGSYEPGAFDVRGGEPRATALAALVERLARGQPAEHWCLGRPGWWQATPPPYRRGPALPRRAPIAVTGANGTLGRAFGHLCRDRRLDVVLLSRQDLDVADEGAVERMITELSPRAVINAAGFVDVDAAEDDPERCRRENVVGATTLASSAARHGAAFVTFSSDLVFDGARDVPYGESDAPQPLNVYGATKAEAERRVLEAHPDALVVRTSAFFGPWDRANFVTKALERLRAGEPVGAGRAVVSPTYVPDLVQACLDLLLDEERGCWHVANVGAISWFELAAEVARRAGLRNAIVEPLDDDQLGWKARRPTYSVLTSERAVLLPTLDAALDRYFDAIQHEGVP
jgi:dTDP-4-dehydrorhamnose reductase